MHFIVIGLDGNDTQAPARRQAVRAAHLDGIRQLKEAGQVIMAAAYLDDNDQMIGSLLLMNMPSRQAVDEYLTAEPYVTGDVWRTIEVRPVRVPPMFLGDWRDR